MFEPTNALGTTLSCIQSIKQYISRTDLCRPAVEEKDLDTIRSAQNYYLQIIPIVVAGQPKTKWVALFTQLDMLVTDNFAVFVATNETYIAEQFTALMTYIRDKIA